jgi:putative transposase
VHSSTHETPDDRLRHVHPDHPVLWLDPVRVAHAFLWTETRTVTAVGTFSLEGNQFQVPPELARRKVAVRFDPYDLTHVEVVCNGQSYEAGPLELVRDRSRHLDPTESDGQAADAPAERTPFHRLVQDHDERERFRRAGRMRFAADDPAPGETP